MKHYGAVEVAARKNLLEGKALQIWKEEKANGDFGGT